VQAACLKLQQLGNASGARARTVPLSDSDASACSHCAGEVTRTRSEARLGDSAAAWNLKLDLEYQHEDPTAR
jgi:hypothetical protein